MGFAPDVSACTGDKDRPVEAGRITGDSEVPAVIRH